MKEEHMEVIKQKKGFSPSNVRHNFPKSVHTKFLFDLNERFQKNQSIKPR